MADKAKMNVLFTTDPDNRGFASMTSQQKLDALSASRTRTGPFPAKRIPQLLTARNKLDAVASLPAAFSMFDDIDYDDAGHVLAISNGMDWLIGKGIADADDKTAVLALNADQFEGSDIKYYRLGRVNLGDVIAAEAL